jgi:hypothetical protein
MLKLIISFLKLAFLYLKLSWVSVRLKFARQWLKHTTYFPKSNKKILQIHIIYYVRKGYLKPPCLLLDAHENLIITISGLPVSLLKSENFHSIYSEINTFFVFNLIFSESIWLSTKVHFHRLVISQNSKR